MRVAAGFTLAELLVTVTLAGVVITGMSHLLAGSWKMFRHQAGMTYHQEAADLFFSVIEQNLAAARATDIFPINWVSTRSGFGSTRLALTYAASALMDRDCLGNKHPGIITNVFYVRPAADSPFQSDDLICAANNTKDTLTQHIAYMQVRYGLDQGRFDQGNFVSQPDGYIDYWTTDVHEAQLYDLISMEVALITKSPFKNALRQSVPADYSVWGNDLDALGIPKDDGYVRRLHTARFNLF